MMAKRGVKHILAECWAAGFMLLAILGPGGVSGQDAEVQLCRKSVFSFSNLGSNPSDAARGLLASAMASLCKEFEAPDGDFVGMGQHCTQITGPDSPAPLLAVQVYGCCDGEIATELKEKYGTSSCTDIEGGTAMPSISIEVIPGELVVGNLLDTTNGTHENSEVADVRNGLEDWRFWGSLLICTIVMLLLCICCMCCLCKRYKKKERDEKYQVERQRRLLAQSNSVPGKSATGAPGRGHDLEDQSPLVKSRRDVDMVEAEYTDSEYDYSAPPTPAARIAVPSSPRAGGSGRSRLQDSSRP